MKFIMLQMIDMPLWPRIVTM